MTLAEAVASNRRYRLNPGSIWRGPGVPDPDDEKPIHVVDAISDTWELEPTASPKRLYAHLDDKGHIVMLDHEFKAFTRLKWLDEPVIFVSTNFPYGSGSTT